MKASAKILLSVLCVTASLLMSLPVLRADLVPLVTEGTEIGTINMPRENLREVEADTGELDPAWTYSGRIEPLHISSGQFVMKPTGMALPETLADEVRITEGATVEVTGRGGNPEKVTNYEPVVTGWETVRQRREAVIEELQLSLPRNAAVGEQWEVTFKLGEPVACIVLPLEAVAREDAPEGKDWAFHLTGRAIERVAVTIGVHSEAGYEIVDGVLPGEKYLAGELDELYTRFQLPIAAIAQVDESAESSANTKRIWSKFILYWGITLAGFAAWLVYLATRKPRRGNAYRK